MCVRLVWRRLECTKSATKAALIVHIAKGSGWSHKYHKKVYQNDSLVWFGLEFCLMWLSVT